MFSCCFVSFIYFNLNLSLSFSSQFQFPSQLCGDKVRKVHGLDLCDRVEPVLRVLLDVERSSTRLGLAEAVLHRLCDPVVGRSVVLRDLRVCDRELLHSRLGSNRSSRSDLRDLPSHPVDVQHEHSIVDSTVGCSSIPVLVDSIG